MPHWTIIFLFLIPTPPAIIKMPISQKLIKLPSQGPPYKPHHTKPFYPIAKYKYIVKYFLLILNEYFLQILDFRKHVD